MKTQTRGIVLVLLAALFWSTAGIGISLVEAPPLAITGWRALFALPILAAALLVKLRPVGTQGRRALFTSKWVLAGAASYLFTVICFVFANKLAGAANAILLQYTAPVHVALLSWPLLGERPRAADLLAMAGCLVGMYFFFADDLSPTGLRGNLLALASGLGFACLALALRKAALEKPAEAGVAALAATTLGNALTVVAALPAVLSAGVPGGAGLPALAALGVFQLGFGYVCYSAGVVHLRAVVAVVLVALEPILNPVWVAVFTGQAPSRASLTGGGIILFSVVAYAVHQGFREQRTRARLRRESVALSTGSGGSANSPGSPDPVSRSGEQHKGRGLPLVLLALLGGAAGLPTDPAEASPASVTFAGEPDCRGGLPTLEEFNALEAQDGAHSLERTKVFPASGPADRGVAVVIHGLNLRPSRMEDIATGLSAAGFTVVRASLSGHAGNMETYRRVDRTRFLRDSRFAVCLALRLAEGRAPGDTQGRATGRVPVSLVGFSLGALVMQDLVNTAAFTRSPFAAQVLLAPAITVRPFTHAVRALTFLPWLSLPSLSLEDYRAAPGTTLAAYAALFESRAALLGTSLERSRVPTLALASPDDELVSLEGLRAFVAERGLGSWTVEPVEKSGHRHPRLVNHLIVDAASFSAGEWARVWARILAFLP